MSHERKSKSKDEELKRAEEAKRIAETFDGDPRALDELVKNKQELALLCLIKNEQIGPDSDCVVTLTRPRHGPFDAHIPLILRAINFDLLKLVEYIATQLDYKFPYPKGVNICGASGKMLKFIQMMGADVDSPQIDGSTWGFVYVSLTPLTAFAVDGRRADIIAAVEDGFNINVLNSNGATILQMLAERLIVDGGFARNSMKTFQRKDFPKNELLTIFQFLVHHGASTENLVEQFESFRKKLQIYANVCTKEELAEMFATAGIISDQLKETLVDAAPNRGQDLKEVFYSLSHPTSGDFGIFDKARPSGVRDIISGYAIETGKSAEEEEKNKPRKHTKKT